MCLLDFGIESAMGQLRTIRLARMSVGVWPTAIDGGSEPILLL